MTLVYFSWIRETIGKSEEEIILPLDVTTVSGLIAHLKSLGEEYQAALAKPELLKIAIDQEYAGPDNSIASASEIAIFPPVTGG